MLESRRRPSRVGAQASLEESTRSEDARAIVKRALLFLVGLIPLFVVYGGAAAWTIWPATLLAAIDGETESWLFGPLLLAAACANAAAAASPLKNTLVRLFPLRADGERRLGCSFMLVLVIWGAIEWLVMSLLHGDDHAFDGDKHFGPETVQGVAASSVMLLASVPLLRGYVRRWRTPARCQDVLYLRRFVGFGNRVLLFAIQRMLARRRSGFVERRLMYLVPSRLEGGLIDAVALAFPGHALSKLFSIYPMALTSPDRTWEAHVRGLLDNAHLVVVDLAGDPAGARGSLDAEIAMILSSPALCDRTLWLIESSDHELRRRWSDAGVPPDRIVSYEKSWRSATWRLALYGVLLVGFLSIATVIVVEQPSLLPYAVPCVLAVVAAWCVAALQPGIDASSREQIRSRLEHLLASR